MSLAIDPEAVSRTIGRLHRRIAERFPSAGLLTVCGGLLSVAEAAPQQLLEIGRPHVRIRVVAGALIAVGATSLVLVSLFLASHPGDGASLSDSLQAIDSAISILIVVGAALFFLLRWEGRRRQGLALAALQEIRAIIHVIDMHQLTKDPSSSVTPATPASPERPLGPELLIRYLDYCSEMLSLSAKVAALYAQSCSDSVVLEAVNDLERLATGLSQKIWQKINIIHRDLDVAQPM